MSENILAYRLLRSANLSEHHQQLVRATISKLDYESMKLQISKNFADQSMDSDNDISIKLESANLSSHNEYSSSGTFYGNVSRPPRSFYGRGANRLGWTRNRGGFRGSATRGMSRPKRGKNPLNDRGVVSRCQICDSMNHWAANCPDATYYTEEYDAYNEWDDGNAEHHVTLYQAAFIGEYSMKTFVAESMSAAILDSGASSTVCGKTWMECYVDGLPAENREKVVYKPSLNSFKFGSGSIFPSLYKAKLPAVVGGKKIMIETDVVDSDIPMLLSKSAMKKADTSINFKDDSVNMFGVKQEIIATSSGHYAVPLNKSLDILKDVSTNKASIILHSESVRGDKMKMAQKLHAQFSHPEKSKLML